MQFHVNIITFAQVGVVEDYLASEIKTASQHCSKIEIQQHWLQQPD